MDFICPGTHQKEKDCTKIEVLSLAPTLKIATAAPENNQEPNQTLKCQCQNGKKHTAPIPHCLWYMCCRSEHHSSLPLDGASHHHTAACCSLPILLITSFRAFIYYHPFPHPLPETPYTYATFSLSSVHPGPAQMLPPLSNFAWMISSKISISLQTCI